MAAEHGRGTVNSLCAYCGVGCGMVLQVTTDPNSDRRHVTKSVGNKSHPANFGRLCTKGATHADMLAAPRQVGFGAICGPSAATSRRADRQSTTRRRGRASGCAAIIDEHGPDALALYVSGQMSIEAQYLANKLAKGFVGTNHIESNSRLCMASAGAATSCRWAPTDRRVPIRTSTQADLFFVIGANMADCHPILFLRMMDRVKAGAKLIVVDPRRTATAEKADLFLQIKPGTDLALLNGLLHLLHRERSTSTPDSSPNSPTAGTRCRLSSRLFTPDKVSGDHRHPAEADIRPRPRNGSATPRTG